MLARYPPYGPFSLQGEGKTGVPGIDLAIPGALSYHHCNCYTLCNIHTCILYVHHQECALGRRGLSRCPLGWAGARTMLTTTQSGHLLCFHWKETLLKIRTHKKILPIIAIEEDHQRWIWSLSEHTWITNGINHKTRVELSFGGKTSFFAGFSFIWCQWMARRLLGWKVQDRGEGRREISDLQFH